MAKNSQHCTMKVICIEAFVFGYPVNDPVGLGGQGGITMGWRRLQYGGMGVGERQGLCLHSAYKIFGYSENQAV